MDEIGERWVGAPHVTVHRDGDGWILLDLATSRYFELNATGFRIHEVLVAGGSAAEAAEALCREFDVDAGSARAAVDDLVRELSAAGLLLRPGEQPPSRIRRLWRRLRG